VASTNSDACELSSLSSPSESVPSCRFRAATGEFLFFYPFQAVVSSAFPHSLFQHFLVRLQHVEMFQHFLARLQHAEMLVYQNFPYLDR